MASRTPLRIALAATTILAGGLLLALPAAAQNLPDTSNVTAVTSGLGGGVPGSTNPVFTTTPNPGGASLRVDLNDNRTLLNWSGTGFNIASGNGVDFRDTRPSAGVTARTDNIAVLNRDMTGNMSFVRGSLTAESNVAVYVLNRAGVYIGPGASIDVGALLVSGLDLADDNDFLSGSTTLRFNRGAGSVVLGGAGTTIRTHGSASGNGGRMGDVVAFGATIATGGTLLADGDVGLVAAADVTVQNAPGSPLTFTIARGSSFVDPFGLITVDGSVTGRNITVAGARSASASGGADVVIAGTLVATAASVTDRGVVLTAGAPAPGIAFSSGPGTADVAAAGTVAVSGSIASAKDVVLAAADPSRILGSLAADGLLGLDGNIDLGTASSPGSGTVRAGSIAVRGSTSIWNPTTVTTGSFIFFNTGTLGLNAPIAIAGNLMGTGGAVSMTTGSLTLGGGIAVTTSGNQDWLAPVSAGGAIDMHSTAGTIMATGSLAGSGDIYLAAARPSAILGPIAATRLLDLTGSFDLGSAASPNSGTISAAGIAVHGTASIWNPTTVGFNGIRFDTGALNLNATTEVRGRLAGTGTGFSLHGALTVYDDIAVTTAGSQYWDASAIAIGPIFLNVTGGSSFTLESLGDIRSTGNSIGMFSSGTVDARGTVNATQLLGIGSSQGTRVAHAMAGLDMSIRSDKDVVIGTDAGTNALMGNGKITVAAGTDVQILGGMAMTGSISGRNISLAATDPSSVRGSLAATGLLDLTGTFDFGPAFSQGTDSIRAGAIAVHGSGAFRNPTTITAGNLSFDTGALSLGAATDIAGDLIGTGTGFSLNGGPLTVGGKISVTTTGNQDWLAPVTAAGSIFMNASDLGAAITAGSDAIRSTGGGIGIYSTGTIDAFGTVDAAGGLSMGAFDRLRIDHAIGAGGIDLDALTPGAKGTLQIGTISSTAGDIRLFGDQIQILPGGPVRMDLTAGGTVDIRATGSEDLVFGNIVAGVDVAIMAGAVDVTSIKAASGGTYMLVDHGVVVGDLQAQTNVYVRGGIMTFGKVTTATRDVSIEASGAITLGTSATADVVTATNGAVSIRAGGPLQMLGNVTTRGAIDIRAQGTTSVAGEWTAGILHDRGGITLATSAGDLTIGAGSAFTGGNIVFATPAIFKFFADPLKMKPDYSANNAWAIYSGNPDVNIYGGLSTNSAPVWNCNLATCPPPRVGASYNVNTYYFTYRPTLTISTVGLTKFYGDVLDAAHVYYSVTGFYPGVPGIFPGDSETNLAILLGKPLITSPGFAERASVAGGPYAQTISIGTLQSRAGYVFAFNNTGLVTVWPRQLGVTAIVDNKVYDGTTAASGTLSVGGMLSGDDVGATGTMFAFADKTAGIGKPVNITGTTLTGADAGNYSLALPTNVLADILKKALTGTVTANSKIYDGTTAATGSIALSGMIAGDDVVTAGSVFSFADRNAGTGKAVSVSGTTLSGADAGNYTLVLRSGALADILKKALAGSVSANAKTYDGTVAGSGTVTLPGAIAGDDVGMADVVFTFADRNAGTSKTVIISGGRLTGGDAGNYTLTLPPSALADILKKALFATVTANSRIYDGTTAASGTVMLSGMIAGDDVATAGTVFSFADKNAGTGKAVTVTGTVLTGADAGNYTLALPASVLADILKKAIGGTVTVDSKTYDGTTAATGTIALGGVVAGDAVAATGTIFSFADKNAGTGKTVTLSGTTLSGVDAGNYTLTLPASTLADILRKGLTATVAIDSKTYDGTAAATGSVTLSGVAAGDMVGTSGAVLAFADANAGAGKTVTITGATLNGADAGNYTLTVPATALGTILRRQLVLTPDSLSKTQGEPDPAFTFTITGGSLVTGDRLTGALGRDPGELPGRYAILVGTLSAGQNYDLQLAAAQFLIFARLSESGLQPFKVVVLPSQIPSLDAPGGQVTLGTLDLCGDDQGCAASN